LALPIARLTTTLDAPGTSVSARSTCATHEAQVMPWTGMVSDFILTVIIVPFGRQVRKRRLLLRALIGPLLVISCAMAALIIVPTVHAAHHQEMHQRAQQHERKGQHAQDVRGVVDEQGDERRGQDGRQRRTLRRVEDGGQAAWWRLLMMHGMLLV